MEMRVCSNKWKAVYVLTFQRRQINVFCEWCHLRISWQIFNDSFAHATSACEVHTMEIMKWFWLEWRQLLLVTHTVELKPGPQTATKYTDKQQRLRGCTFHSVFIRALSIISCGSAAWVSRECYPQSIRHSDPAPLCPVWLNASVRLRSWWMDDITDIL